LKETGTKGIKVGLAPPDCQKFMLNLCYPNPLTYKHKEKHTEKHNNSKHLSALPCSAPIMEEEKTASVKSFKTI
jgi:hypothetical protein